MNVMTNRPLSDTLCDERQAFAELARDLAQKKLVENIEEHDRYPFAELFTEAIRDAGVVGFYGVNLSSECGGVDMNTAMVAVILDQLSQYDASLAGVVFTNAAALEIIQKAADDFDSAAMLQGITSLGSTPIAFQSFAGPDETDIPEIDDAGRITGKISYLVLGNIADYAVIPAKKQGTENFSWYLINLGDETLAKSKPVVSLGFHACPAVDVSLKETAGTLIGAEGKGRDYFDMMQHSMSLCAAAISLGVMKGSLKSAIEYTAERYQGGRQIIDWPQVRMLLADMAIQVKIGETCLSRSCQELENSCSGWEYSALASAVHIGEMATRCTTDGVQLFGGNGYTKDYPQEKRMRDARQAQALLGMVPLKKINYIGSFLQKA
ncbi:MAG TPA: acyl-CoA dehydrogenase family protein [Spirochaetota bacterium]|nr:acyl-CoA dehydrogenase family protein [Spirochaetota bacterium]HPI88506.1 acyl-CoA dehydrogenase family protein [Spirochaetota bacterium]HPR47986.1 acyl-CoA dehydrogenase family protein [Spirochaetota bacterium]